MSREGSKRRGDRHAETDDGFWLRFTAFWVGPVEALPLRVFESLFTVTFLVWMGRCFLTWEEWLTDAGFHLTEAELRSMGYPAPWPLLEPWQVPIFGGLIVLGAVLLLWPVRLGCGQAGKLAPLFRRAGLVLLFATALYAQRVDYMAAFTLSKFYGIGFHLIIALMMKDLIFFSVQMWTFYAVFVSEEGWRRLSFGSVFRCDGVRSGGAA